MRLVDYHQIGIGQFNRPGADGASMEGLDGCDLDRLTKPGPDACLNDSSINANG